MNPASNIAQKPNAPTLRDVVPKRPEPKPETVVPTAAPAQAPVVKAEIVHDIPVKNPIEPGAAGLPQAAANPITASAKAFGEPENEDKALDQILKDVNTSVKKSEKDEQVLHEDLSGRQKKKVAKKAKAAQMSGQKPVAATVIAVAVASILIVSALMLSSKS